MISATENNERLSYIMEGPWAESASSLINYLFSMIPSDYSYKTQNISDIEKIIAYENIDSLYADINIYLNNINNPDIQMDIVGNSYKGKLLYSNSYPDALLTLKLIELSIQSKFIEFSQIEDYVNKLLTVILWPKDIRKLLLQPQYIQIRNLAYRVDLDLGLPKIKSFSQNLPENLNFEAFLSINSKFFTEDNILVFLRYLSGYKYTSTDPNLKVLDYISSGFESLLMYFEMFFSLIEQEEELIQYSIFWSDKIFNILGYSIDENLELIKSNNVLETILTHLQTMNLNDENRFVIEHSIINFRKLLSLILDYIEEKGGHISGIKNAL